MWKAVGALVAVVRPCVASCSTAEPTGGGGGGGSGGAVEIFGSSECGLCLGDNCQAEWTTCYEDPGCALHLDCLLACPVASDGDVDEACASTCPVADSSTAQEAIGSLEYCRTLGVGADACPACNNQRLEDPDLNQVCEPSAETNTCWKCQDEFCCETDQSCRDNAECLALFECMQSCSLDSDTCFTDCYALHPDGQLDVGAKFGCAVTKCTEECGSNSPCVNCAATRCGNEWMACWKNPACVLAEECVAGCAGEVDCWADCMAMYPNGEADALTKSFCSYNQCTAECAGL